MLRGALPESPQNGLVLNDDDQARSRLPERHAPAALHSVPARPDAQSTDVDEYSDEP